MIGTKPRRSIQPRGADGGLTQWVDEGVAVYLNDYTSEWYVEAPIGVEPVVIQRVLGEMEAAGYVLIDDMDAEEEVGLDRLRIHCRKVAATQPDAVRAGRLGTLGYGLGAAVLSSGAAVTAILSLPPVGSFAL